MATSLSLENDSSLAQGYLKVNGTTAATITENGISTPTLNTISVDDYTILSDFTGTNQSLTTNGFQKLPGGLIIQWGKTGTIVKGSFVTVTFPMTFPNSIISVQATMDNTIGITSTSVAANVINTSSMRVYHVSDNNASANYYWFAIGN